MILTVHVKTRAAKDEIISWLDQDTVKVAVKAAPEKGKANKAVLNLLAKELKLPPTSLKIIRGVTASLKQIEIP